MDITQKIKTFPLTSGVYLMKNASRKVLYVGKAVSLRRRVQSYFRPSRGVLSTRRDRDAPARNKTDLLISEVRDIDTILTNSEAEALILEASLIKKYQPKYNIELRDDKSYPYIEITAEKFPRIAVVRPRKNPPQPPFKKGGRTTGAPPFEKGGLGGIFYGPYVNPGLIREALTIIQKIFPFRTCNPFPKKECLLYHIGLCDAPCIHMTTKKEYAKNIRNVRLILEGKKDLLHTRLKKEMEAFSRTKNFEKAARIRDQIRAIGALYSGTRDINYYKEAEQLQRVLNLARRPERIEAFDISNIMGRQSVGSMVSFFSGKPDKSHYRRFRIKEVQGIDDFAMMGEIVKRRYRRLKKSPLNPPLEKGGAGGDFPDLIVIDGGKGQLSAACNELKKLEVDISIISLAKREEEVFLPGRRNSVILPKDSLGLKLLQRVRDEAHRFAVLYHRKLRRKNVYKK